MKNHTIILEEINKVLDSVNENDIDAFINYILKSRNIVTCGAGRVGYSIRGFCMRLGHFGFKANHIGDTCVPSIGKGDLFLVASGSGETQTIFDLTQIAKSNGANVFLITGNKNSRIAKLADVLLLLEAPSKTKEIKGFKSLQPMTTLNEQCLGILLDTVVLEIMKKTGESHETMWKRHSNLE